MQATNTVSRASKAGGLLLTAYKAGLTETIDWIDIQVGDLIITVAKDAVKGPVGDQTGVRLPVTYREQVELCRELGCVSPTQAIADAMFARANPQLNFVPLVRTAADSMKMGTVDFTLRFHDGVQKQLASTDLSTCGVLHGAWKLWILHPRIVERGAVNYGFWDKSRKPPKPIQSVGGQHDAAHYDYSQVFQPVKRMARKASTGEEVDLLDYMATKDRIPAKYLEPYRQKEAPSNELVSFLEPEEREVDLFEVLKSAGVDVVAVDGWTTRGRPGFAPEGILIHHTAGPKTGDAPSLNLCIKGRIDPKNPKNNISGPLCHIVLARSGKAHVIGGNIANHAGMGSKEVLEMVRRDEPVVGNASGNKFADAISGNPFFYGIEVENAGIGNDPYPEAQITALANICAALCQAHGWSANRVVHHRQWTARKIDMSYRGDVPGMVAQLMDSGTIYFGISFSEEEDELSPDAEPCLPWDGYDETSATTGAAKPASAAKKRSAGKPNKKKAPTAKKKAAAKKMAAKSKAPAAKPRKKVAAKPKKKVAAKPKKKGLTL